MRRHREEVLNTVLAACLSSRGIEAHPETITRNGRARPDVIATFRGLRCVIEGKIADAAKAKILVAEDARKRVDQGIAHIAIAVVYPSSLRTTDLSELPDELGVIALEFAVLTEAGDGEWRSGGIDDILGELRRAHEVLVRDDVLQQAVGILHVGLEEVANALLGNIGACDRLIGVLGVGDRTIATPAV